LASAEETGANPTYACHTMNVPLALGVPPENSGVSPTYPIQSTLPFQDCDQSHHARCGSRLIARPDKFFTTDLHGYSRMRF
jgi:hypothetical protein